LLNLTICAKSINHFFYLREINKILSLRHSTIKGLRIFGGDGYHRRWIARRNSDEWARCRIALVRQTRRCNGMFAIFRCRRKTDRLTRLGLPGTLLWDAAMANS
jgi:hypothetical protein